MPLRQVPPHRAATQGCQAGIYIPASLSWGGAAAGFRRAALHQAAHSMPGPRMAGKQEYRFLRYNTVLQHGAATRGCNVGCHAGIYIPASLGREGQAAGLYQAAHDITL